MNPALEDQKRIKRSLIEGEMRKRGIKIPKERTLGEAIDAALGRNRPQVDNVSGTPVPAGAPRAAETLEQYKTRKYNEHQKRVREINDAGGNAGFLRREEWEQFHGPAVEENWNRAQQRNGGRGARRTATDAGAARTATRRPAPADAPDAVQPARRQRKPFNAPGQRGLSSEAAARRKRNQMELDNSREPNEQNLRIVKHNGKYFVVPKAEVDRANANGANLDVVNEPPGRPPVRRPAAPAPAAPTPPSTPPSPAAPAAPARPQGAGAVARPVNRAKNRHTKELVALGGPDGRMVKVANGNKGINNAQDAMNYTGPLTDVPDEFLEVAMDARSVLRDDLPPGLFDAVSAARMNPSNLSAAQKASLLQMKQSGKHFVAVRGRSITAPTFYMHIADDGSIDGRGYLLKPPDPDSKGRGQHSELVGVEIARRMGFAAGSGRAFQKNGETFILTELGPNFAEGHVADFNGAGVTDERSRMGHFIANMLVKAADRHGANGMYFPGNGALPIDFGRAFGSDTRPIDAASMANYSFPLDNRSLRGYRKFVTSGQMTEAQAKARLKADLVEMKTALQKMFDDGSYDELVSFVPDAASGRDGYLSVSSRKARLQTRINLLDSDQFINEYWARASQ
jgi:hypothetical protein